MTGTEAVRSGVAQHLGALSARMIASAFPGGQSVSHQAINELARAKPRDVAGVPTVERRAALAGMILTRARGGRSRDAIELVELEVERDPAGGVETESSLSAAFWAAAAEAYVTAGWPRLATLYSRRAADYAAETGDDPVAYWALGLQAVSRALNGEYEGAESALEQARVVQNRLGWPVSIATYPHILGEVLIASALFDAGRLGACVEMLLQTNPDDPLWRSTAVSADAMRLLIRGQTAEAIGMITTVTNGADGPGILSMIRGFALGVLADLLLGQGEARRALALLRGQASPAGHALCFDMQRAAGYLLLGQNRDALTTTDACLALGREHCLRTIPPLLFRRAIAHDRLGNQKAADNAFEEGFHLIASSGSSTPLLTLPAGELLTLLDRLVARRPELAARADDIRERLARIPAVDVAAEPLPTLTRRETAVAWQLREGQTMEHVARALQVSPNTLKTQVRSLYAKLGVSNRNDALNALEGAGFFV